MGWQDVLGTVGKVAGAASSFLGPVGGIASAVGGIASMFKGSSNQNFAQNLALMREQNEFNSNEATRAFNRADNLRQWQNQFAEDMYKKYQSPQAMASQLRRAGLNPNVAMGDASGSPSVSSGSSGSVAPATASQTPFSPMSSPGNWVDMASSLSALAQAKKAGVETENMQKLIDEQFRGLAIDNNMKQFLYNQEVKWNDKKTQAEVNKFVAEAQQGFANAKALREAARLTGVEIGLKGKQLEHWVESWSNQQGLIKSEQALNEASARTKDSETALNNELAENQPVVRENIQADTRQIDAETQRLVQDLGINKPIESLAKLQDMAINHGVGSDGKMAWQHAFDSFVKDIESNDLISGFQFDMFRQQLEIATKQNNWFYVGQVLDALKDAILSYAFVKGVSKGTVSSNRPRPRMRSTVNASTGHAYGSSGHAYP